MVHIRPFNYYIFNITAEELGVKELLPAYFDPNLQPEDFKTGVSFASGGCGFDPLTTQLAVIIFKYTYNFFPFISQN